MQRVQMLRISAYERVDLNKQDDKALINIATILYRLWKLFFAKLCDVKE